MYRMLLHWKPPSPISLMFITIHYSSMQNKKGKKKTCECRILMWKFINDRCVISFNRLANRIQYGRWTLFIPSPFWREMDVCLYKQDNGHNYQYGKMSAQFQTLTTIGQISLTFHYRASYCSIILYKFALW